jgi:nucleotide-binding universal stress UspA family protein
VSGSSRVVVGVGGSPGSIRALRYGAEIALSDDAPLVAVLAWVPPGGDLGERRAPSPYLRQIWERAASDRLLAALDSAWGGTPLGLSVRRVVARGEAGRVLVDMADAAEDLLVVGAGGRGLLTRPWHGQVARYCLAHASCPVLAVPPSPLAAQTRGLRRWSFRRARLGADQLLGQDPQHGRKNQHGETRR